MAMEQKRRAGFWIKSCAQLIDLALVAAAIILVAKAMAGWGLYIPIEITVIVVYLVYAGTAVGWKGQTLGDAALGLCVTRRDGRNVGWARGLLRVGTVVTRPERLATGQRLALAAVLTLAGAYLGFSAFGVYRLYRMHRAWVADADAALSRRPSTPGSVVEAAAVDAAQRAQMAAWLAEHGEDPAKTVVDLASTHQVTIVGEIHHKKDYLNFFNEIIPDLYDKAGVRVLALEWCPASQNRNLARLVESGQFDRELLLTIARRAPWEAWGDKEYWDVLETVWRVNQSRPKGSEPLRVVGMHFRFDYPSSALLYEGPWYEKLRLIRVGGIIRGFLGNACYARCVEREAFDRGRRTLVWVGAGHTALCPYGQSDLLGLDHSMAFMLTGRYGSAVGQAVLHHLTETDRVARLIEESAKECSRTRVALATADSPFAKLRDQEVYEYQYRPGKGLADLVSHYLMLMPEQELQECSWLEGFLSRRMLGRNRPYYEWLAGGHIDDLAEGNRRIVAGARKL